MDEKLMALPLEEKIKKAKDVVSEAFDRFGRERIAVAWTGGKDSTLLLWIVREACREKGIGLPKIMFIDEGDPFEEVLEFVERIRKEWNLDLAYVRNEDVLKQVKKVGDIVRVDLLNERNRKELERLGFKGKEFPFEPESYVGNHLMKTVAMSLFLEENGYKALVTGVRWDEQEARANEKFFSPRENPEHVRVHPILHFTEKDVWNAIHGNGIPVNPLYEKGYRSLGVKSTTEKADDRPAWEQDLEKTPERKGRRQDKENIMKRLRELGYM